MKVKNWFFSRGRNKAKEIDAHIALGYGQAAGPSNLFRIYATVNMPDKKGRSVTRAMYFQIDNAEAIRLRDFLVDKLGAK